MDPQEELRLRWNDFQTNVASSLQQLRSGEELTDVTLVCEDGGRVEAHRVVLACGSDFFRSVLGGASHPHPLVYMRGVRAALMEDLCDFIYKGEVSVTNQDLDGFLQLATELEVKGLVKHGEVAQEKAEAPDDKDEPRKKKSKTKEIIEIDQPKEVEDKSTDGTKEQVVGETLDEHYKKEIKTEDGFDTTTNLSIPSKPKVSVLFGVKNAELEEQISRMLQRDENGWGCSACGKTQKENGKLRRHVETHIDGYVHLCSFDGCGKEFRYVNYFVKYVL